MNLYIISCLIAVATGAQLPSNNYLPQGQGPSGSRFGGNSFDGSGGIGGFSGFGGANGNYGGNGNRRPQQAQEKNAAILKQDQGISENGDYNFGYETENGIRAEETSRGEQAEGGFSYTGDDGRVYTVTYTAGEGGFRAQGAHLPVAPPTPEAILEALRQNAKDEASGIFDDGQYRADAQGFPGNRRPGQGYSGNRPGQFGSGGNQNGFNPNSGYTY